MKAIHFHTFFQFFNKMSCILDRLHFHCLSSPYFFFCFCCCCCCLHWKMVCFSFVFFSFPLNGLIYFWDVCVSIDFNIWLFNGIGFPSKSATKLMLGILYFINKIKIHCVCAVCQTHVYTRFSSVSRFWIKAFFMDPTASILYQFLSVFFCFFFSFLFSIQFSFTSLNQTCFWVFHFMRGLSLMPFAIFETFYFNGEHSLLFGLCCMLRVHPFEPI